MRSLSDFPESPRGQQIDAAYPGVFDLLDREFAAPVTGKPYRDSGICLCPIDFRRLPDLLLHNRMRFTIPVEHLDPLSSCLTYVLDGRLWDAARLQCWFGVERNRRFYTIPQVATWPESGIPVTPANLDYPPAP